MRKETFANCKSLKRVEVAKGCRVAVRYYVQPNTKIAQASPETSAEEEFSNEVDDKTTVLENLGTAGGTMQRLWGWLQKVAKPSVDSEK